MFRVDKEFKNWFSELTSEGESPGSQKTSLTGCFLIGKTSLSFVSKIAEYKKGAVPAPLFAWTIFDSI